MQVIDLWNYAQQRDASRLRLAVGAVQFAVRDRGIAYPAPDGAVVVKLDKPPLWARFTFGGWRWWVEREIRDRCMHWVPKVCGWAPEIRVTT